MEELKILALQKVRVKIGDETITCKKITLGDYADLQEYIKAEYIKEEMENAAVIYGEVPLEVKDEIRKSITPEKLDALSNTHRGMMFLVSRAMQPTVKGIDPKDISDMSIEALTEIMEAVAPPDPEEKKRKRQPVKK